MYSYSSGIYKTDQLTHTRTCTYLQGSRDVGVGGVQRLQQSDISAAPGEILLGLGERDAVRDVPPVGQHHPHRPQPQLTRRGRHQRPTHLLHHTLHKTPHFPLLTSAGAYGPGRTTGRTTGPKVGIQERPQAGPQDHR